MPTAPQHHGCSASQAITSHASACSAGRYSSMQHAVGVAGAPDVHPHRRRSRARRSTDAWVPSRCAVPSVSRYGQVLEHGRDGIVVGVDRQYGPREQTAAVGQRDPVVAHRRRSRQLSTIGYSSLPGRRDGLDTAGKIPDHGSGARPDLDPAPMTEPARRSRLDPPADGGRRRARWLRRRPVRARRSSRRFPIGAPTARWTSISRGFSTGPSAGSPGSGSTSAARATPTACSATNTSHRSRTTTSR